MQAGNLLLATICDSRLFMMLVALAIYIQGQQGLWFLPMIQNNLSSHYKDTAEHEGLLRHGSVQCQHAPSFQGLLPSLFQGHLGHNFLHSWIWCGPFILFAEIPRLEAQCP